MKQISALFRQECFGFDQIKETTLEKRVSSGKLMLLIIFRESRLFLVLFADLARLTKVSTAINWQNGEVIIRYKKQM